MKLYEDSQFIELVLEYQPKGSLMQSLQNEKKFSEPEVRVIMEQILLALDFFEQKKIVHRDIKPDNILIKSIEDSTEYEVRVADLGLAVFLQNNKLLTHKCGTPGYVAPEVFSFEGYNYKADIFSLGSVFFNLLTGCFLFIGDSPEELLRNNIQCVMDDVNDYLTTTSPLC